MNVNTQPQRGMVLLVVLVMLGILTLIVAALVRSGNVNLQIAGNQQFRDEARMAAQSAIETYISRGANFDTPPSTAATYGFDLDGDGNNEFGAVVPPATEVGVSPVAPEALLPNTSLFTQCSNEMGSGPVTIEGSTGVAQHPRQCAYKVYDVGATVTDEATGTSVELHQGIRRVSKLN